MWRQLGKLRGVQGNVGMSQGELWGQQSKKWVQPGEQRNAVRNKQRMSWRQLGELVGGRSKVGVQSAQLGGKQSAVGM